MNEKSEKRICQSCKNEFIIESNDFSFYERIEVPVPKICPTCRQQRRTLFRNFKTLYRRLSDKSKKMIVSMYNPDAKFPVWEASEWWTDDWEATDYYLDLDLSKPFLKQVDELFNRVPHFSLMNTRSEKCEYSNMAYGSKNCYLVFGCVEDENCDYGHIVWNSTDCVDNLYLHKCELCYECVDCVNCNKLLFSQECESCADSLGLYDCRDCVNCIGCVGLRHRNFHIFNQQVSKEEYEKFIKKYSLKDEVSIIYILNKKEELRKKNPTRAVFGSHNENVSGDHVYNAHNVKESFDIKSGENSKYCYTSGSVVESRDISFNPKIEYSYQCLASLGSSYLISTHLVTDSSYVYYSDSCFNSKNLFGCFGLRNKEYHILNKKYSKEEYEKLVPQIIGNMKKTEDWGNFFAIWMCPFGYNESISNEYTPLTQEEAENLGFNWRDNIPFTSGQENCKYDELPKSPEDYKSSELLEKILKCDQCDKNYRFISREIDFYKKMSLALPSKCFNCRHQNRMNLRNPRILNDVFCFSCGDKTKTTYPLEKHRLYKIYCEDCYKKEIN